MLCKEAETARSARFQVSDLWPDSGPNVLVGTCDEAA
jgi:hypothetical protein